MRSKFAMTILIVAVFGGSYLAKARIVRPEVKPTGQAREARRIVSLAPSITETLFALGLGDRVVGVTRFCDYPPEACNKARVGGYLDPNYEAILRLRPDLVVTLEDIAQAATGFEKLGLQTLTVTHTSVEGILTSIDRVGRACDREPVARAMVADIESRIETVQERTARLPRPSVMFVIDRTLGVGRLEDVCIAGCDGHIDRIIELAGGQNVYRQGTVRFPIVSHEGILNMDPEVIVDLALHLSGEPIDRETLLADWQQLGRTKAVADGRVHVLEEQGILRPGPRFILLVEELARLVHPEVNWDE